MRLSSIAIFWITKETLYLITMLVMELSHEVDEPYLVFIFVLLLFVALY